jgi:CRP-like cAMP-binding protein
MSSPSQSYTANTLLGVMSADDFALLTPHFERIKLGMAEPLVMSNEPIEYVHFLEGGVGSIVTSQQEGEIEVGLFGREGMSGTAILLGADRTPHRSFMQVDGTTALRISSDRLRQACRESETLQTLLLRYVQYFTLQAAQTAAANANYDLPERLARWLLMCHDRLDGDEIKLTHEFMAMMLAVRRSGVTVTLHTLEGSGALRSTRGLVTIVNRDRLEEIAGDSYGLAEAEYSRLIAPFGRQSSPGIPDLKIVR